MSIQVYDGHGIKCQHCAGKGCRYCRWEGEALEQYEPPDFSPYCRDEPVMAHEASAIIFWKPTKALISQVMRMEVPYRFRHLPFTHEMRKLFGKEFMSDAAVVNVFTDAPTTKDGEPLHAHVPVTKLTMCFEIQK